MDGDCTACQTCGSADISTAKDACVDGTGTVDGTAVVDDCGVYSGGATTPTLGAVNAGVGLVERITGLWSRILMTRADTLLPPSDARGVCLGDSASGNPACPYPHAPGGPTVVNGGNTYDPA